MTLNDLITIMTNRLDTLNGSKVTAQRSGDLAQVTRLDDEINETQQTLDQLRSIA